jgi:hypothetical protein
MSEESRPLYLFDLFDQMYSQLLEVDIETFSDVMDNRCTFWEGMFILGALNSEREDKIEKAKQIFNSKLK